MSRAKNGLLLCGATEEALSLAGTRGAKRQWDDLGSDGFGELQRAAVSHERACARDAGGRREGRGKQPAVLVCTVRDADQVEVKDAGPDVGVDAGGDSARGAVGAEVGRGGPLEAGGADERGKVRL